MWRLAHSENLHSKTPIPITTQFRILKSYLVGVFGLIRPFRFRFFPTGRPPVRSGTFNRIYDQFQHAPPTLHGGAPCMRYNVDSAVQLSSHPMTSHATATCDLPQPAAPTPQRWTSRRAPAGRSRSAGQEQRDEGSQRPRRREP